MKKFLSVLSLLLVIVLFTAAVPVLAVDSFDYEYRSTTTYELNFKGVSGNSYLVDFETDYIGFNHTTTGPKVKACQAFIRVASGTPIAIDGI